MTKPTGNPRGRPRKSRQDAQSQVNTDGWSNVLQNLGSTSGNPASSTKYRPGLSLDSATLDDIYTGDGLGARVVDVIVDDAMRGGIECAPEMLTELMRIGTKQTVTDAAKWARLYGGGILVALIDDGGDLADPVSINNVRRVAGLRAYDRHMLSWTTADMDNDPNSAHFGQMEYFTVSPLTGTPFRVHRSRFWRFDGKPVPERVRVRNNGWGDSVLQSVFEALRNYGTAMNASVSIVSDFVQVVLGIKGLSDMLRQGEDDLVAKRATIIDLTRSVANTVFIDADGETYDKKASSVAGLADLWDRFALHVSATTGIPATKLMGQSPGGLNATGDSDIRQWYDVVDAYRGDEIAPCVDWIITLLDAQTMWARADRPETLDWVWPSLWQPTEAAWAEVKLKNAQADQIYIDRGAVDAQYLFHLRFGQGEYRPDITFEMSAYLEWLAEDVALGQEETGGGAIDKQREALNGAQIKALQEIALAVTAGQMASGTAIEIITAAFEGIDESQAKRIIDPAKSSILDAPAK